MLKFNPRPLHITIAAILLTLLTIGVIIYPNIKEIRNVNTRIKNHRKGLELMYRQGQHFKYSIDEYEEVKPNIPLVESAMFELGRELDVITTLESIASDVRVEQIINLDTSDDVPLDNVKTSQQYRRVILRLDISGTYSQLITYLQELESLHPYINILNLKLINDYRRFPSFTPSDESSEVPQGQALKVNLTAATYWSENKDDKITE